MLVGPDQWQAGTQPVWQMENLILISTIYYWSDRSFSCPYFSNSYIKVSELGGGSRSTQDRVVKLDKLFSPVLEEAVKQDNQ